MDQILNNILNLYNNKLFYETLGISFYEILIFFFISLLLIAFRRHLSKFLFLIIKNLFKNSEKFNQKKYKYLQSPLGLTIPLIIILYLTYLTNQNVYLKDILSNISKSIASLFIFWMLYGFYLIFSDSFKTLDLKIGEALRIWVSKAIKYLLVFLCIVSILEIWGIKIGPILAGLGLFGVAIALGAQDLFKNLISGVLILIESRFKIGDVINVPSFGEGVVEHIGFRSTTIRLFDSTPLAIPNFILSDSAISNYSKRHFRRISWIIGLEYSSSIEQLKNITEDIFEYIKTNNKSFIINENYKAYVRVEKFNDSSIDILIYCFTNTVIWEDYLIINEDLALNIKDIVEEQNKAKFAFPSKSIYIEKNT